MAAYETYDTTREAEDVQDVIYNIAPVDTPIISMARDLPARARLHEWTEDTLRARGSNKAIEGAVAAFSTPTPPVPKSNHLQIFDETAEISGTLEAVKLYGRSGAMAYELAKKYEELSNDIEWAVAGTPNSGGTARQTGSAGAGSNPGAAAAREMAGIHAQLDAGVIVDADTFVNGTTPISTVAHLEQALLTAHRQTYDLGGNPNYMVVPTQHAISIAGFANSAGRSRDINNERTIVNTIDLYVSPFGSLDVVLDRNLDPISILLLDFEYLANGILRPVEDYEIAKVGDADRRQIITERTFCVLNSKAHACVDNIPATLTA